MKRRTISLRAMAAACALLLCASADGIAAVGYVIANVNRVLVSADDRWGGCMAALSIDPQSVLPACSSWWVSFSCSGDFTDRVRAYRMLDEAQLGLATGKKVAVWFQDDKKHNGYCFANRIDIVR